MAKTPDLGRKGACNQGKEAFRAEFMQSGATPPSVTTGENVIQWEQLPLSFA